MAHRILTTHVGSLRRPERVVTYADIVGRDRVMAATDCGFGTFAGFGAIHPPICLAKLASMAEGTEMASKELWS